MTKFGSIVITLVVALFASGCATPTKMAFQGDAKSIPAGMGPVFLMTATLKNFYKPSYQPEMLVVNVEKPDAKNSEDRFNFTVDDQSKTTTNAPESGNTYFARMELAKGDYIIRGITGSSGTFPVRGMFFAPLHVNLKSTTSGVYYLGHVDATVRERKENEFKAGPPIPLIDQAVTGFSGGTFDIEITDLFDKDVSEFKSRFPLLRDVTIQKAIMPKFDREKAQQWWEAH